MISFWADAESCNGPVSIHILSQVALSQQLGAQPLPFPGMDKSGAAVCEFYVRIYSLYPEDCIHATR